MKIAFQLFAAIICLTILYGCKKDSAAPVKTSIVGKWQVVKQTVSFIRDGAEVNNSIRTNYTVNDYYQYFADGTGLMSANTPAENGVSKFTYTLQGAALVQFNGGVEKGIAETITRLTDSTLSIHYELQAPDPVTTVTETEKDDFDFKKVRS